MTAAENTKLVTDDDALALVRLRGRRAGDIRALLDACPNAVVVTAEGRRWDAVRLANWAHAIGAIALAFAPSSSTTAPTTKRGSGGRR